jgi:uncharacterized protein (TIGR02391 family)
MAGLGVSSQEQNLSMSTLQELIPEVEVFLALEPGDLASHLLQVAKSHLRNDMFHPDNVTKVTSGVGYEHLPWPGREREVERALSEAWNWLQVQGLIVQAPGINGQNGFFVISSRGQQIANSEDFRRFREAASFPKSMLHPSIADKVWLNLARGDLADAVFTAFRAVEEAVRKAGGYSNADIGVDLMRKAFHPDKGPLTDTMQEKGEREALGHMFAGAIGSYKNPHSHRTVDIIDAKEAQEMVVLASHLLRIVEARAARISSGAGSGSAPP